MYDFIKLNKTLIETWNEVYINSVNYRNDIRTVLNEHKTMTQNKFIEVRKYPFIESAFK